MAETLVWAFKPIADLGNQVGFVSCETSKAAALISAGKVQDPAIGATHFKAIEKSTPTPIPSPEPASDEVMLDDMTVAELKEYASDEGIDLGDAKKKADIIAAIEAA